MTNFRLLSLLRVRGCVSCNVRNISGPSSEIRIPVPYGHIAGKAWGDPEGKPILALHGWLDNAATYDELAPRLPEGYRLVCLDQPGHGLSSRYPPGMFYKVSDSFYTIRVALEYLKWDKAVLMGHSLGGGMATFYSAIFPEQVEKLISIDLISFGAVPLSKQVQATRRAVLEAKKTQDKLSQPGLVPSYSFEDACGKAYMATNFMNGMGSVTKESTEILMRRGLTKVEGPDEERYTWTADLRLRIPTAFNMVQEVAEEYCSKVSSPHLLIKATDSNKFMSDENYNRFLKLFRNHNPHFLYREVEEGGHHLHLNRADLVAPLVTEFLEKDFETSEERKEFDLV